ncbi:MAG: hypothetical protein U9Q79_12250, partial [Candidatus Hydrogenedentes bacterium]|nr:hypothetical protein [Candidatus Hydrogenedentota bacterium]
MRLAGVAGALVALLMVSVSSWGEIPDANPEDFWGLYKSLENATKAMEPPVEKKTTKGYLRFLGAPQGAAFKVVATGPSDPQVTASQFMQKHGRVFGAVTSRSTFKAVTTKMAEDRASVRLDQEYSGIPVFGAHVFLQTDTNGGVLSALSDIMRETSTLDNNTLSLNPSHPLERAEREALDLMRTTYGGSDYEVLVGRLFVFAPPVVGNSGEPCLVWAIIAVSQT